jgi:anti-anti-sigma factor
VYNKAALEEDAMTMTMVDGGLRIHEYRVDDVAVVVLGGDVDSAAAPLMRATFDAFGPDEHIYVDCAGVEFVDSEGLAALCEVAQRNVIAGGPLHVLASTALRRSIWINEVGHLFILS